MLKRIAKGLSLVLVPVCIVIVVLMVYDDYLDRKIGEIYNPEISRVYGVDEKDKGMCILEKNAERDDILLIGSSELNSVVPQNPGKMFPNTTLDRDISLIGRAYVQSLLNTIRIGALSEDFKDKKIVTVVSYQWFMSPEIDQSGYQAHFSELQFYNIMNNTTISDDIKKYVCQRTTSLAENQSKLAIPYTYAFLYSQDNIVSNAALFLLKPYYFAREKFIALKDKHVSYKKLKQFQDTPERETLDIDWEAEMQKAEQMGQEACTNNDMYVNDSYYETYLKPNWEALKDSNAGVDTLSSNEFKDYEIFLKLCQETGIKPYFIFTPTNGRYYDYLGVTKEKRDAYFDKITTMTRESGFEYLDLRDKEYEPYYLVDVMHLGWKGWLAINEEISRRFS